MKNTFFYTVCTPTFEYTDRTFYLRLAKSWHLFMILISRCSYCTTVVISVLVPKPVLIILTSKQMYVEPILCDTNITTLYLLKVKVDGPQFYHSIMTL